MISLLVNGIHAALLAGPPVVRGVARFLGRRKRDRFMKAPALDAPALPAAMPTSWARYLGARPEPLGAPPRTVLAVEGYDRFSPADYDALFALCAGLGISVDALMVLMHHESRLDATAWNGIAAGLVQITKDALVPGFDTIERVQTITRMTARQQFEGPILAHLRRQPRLAAMTPGELLLWNFTPSFLGKPEDTVISRSGEAIYEANRGLDRDGKGSIRVGDLFAAAERACAGARGRRAYPDGRILDPSGAVTIAPKTAPATVPAPAPRSPPPRPVPPRPSQPAAPPAAEEVDAPTIPAMTMGGSGSSASAARPSAPIAPYTLSDASAARPRAPANDGAPASDSAADASAAYGMQFSSGGLEDDQAIAESDTSEDVIERFTWTIQYDTRPRDGRFVRVDGGVEMRFAGIDGATRRVPVDLAYTPPSFDEVPAGLQRAATVPTEVGWAARALLGWVGPARKPYGTVIPFTVGGVRYAARVEKHSNAAVGLSMFVVVGDLSSGGPEVTSASPVTGILLAAAQAGTTDPTTWTWVRVEDDLEVLVMDDALKCDLAGVPHVRVPASWAEMREVARLFGCVPPLKEWVDAVATQATFHPTFTGLVQKPGDDKLMNTAGFVLRYHQQLEAQLAKAGVDTSTTFVEPIAKWWIFSDRMPNWEARYGVRGVAGLYGSTNPDGTRIQPDSAVHDSNHSDYSMVCRLVSAWGRRPSQPGEVVDLIALMQQRKPLLASYIALFRRES